MYGKRRYAAGTRRRHRWYSTVVSQRWLLADTARAATDTVVESELVLFTANPSRPIGGDTLITPVWHYRFEAEVLRSGHTGACQHGRRRRAAGDRGMRQRYRRPLSNLPSRAWGRWHDVRLPFLDSLNRRYPSAITHGYRIDIRTMRGTASIYSLHDPNCCPSQIAEMRLRLRNGGLEMVSSRTVAP